MAFSYRNLAAQKPETEILSILSSFPKEILHLLLFILFKFALIVHSFLAHL